MRTLMTMLSILGLALAASLHVVAADEPATETGSISGKVVDGDGKAVPNAMVFVTAVQDTVRGDKNKDKSSVTPLQAKDKPRNPKGNAIAGVATKADGTFKVEKVPAGKYAVSARAVGLGTGKTAVPITVTAGQDTDAGTIILKGAPR